MSEPIFATATEYAKHRGVTDSMVRRYRRQGRLVLADDGRIVVHASDALLGRSLHPSKGGAPDKSRAAGAGARGEAGGDDPQDFHTAVTREKRARAELAELELAEKKRDLVPRVEVEQLVEGLALFCREALLALPGRIGADLSLLTLPTEIEDLLISELRRICDRMVEAAAEAPLLREIQQEFGPS